MDDHRAIGSVHLDDRDIASPIRPARILARRGVFCETRSRRAKRIATLAMQNTRKVLARDASQVRALNTRINFSLVVRFLRGDWNASVRAKHPARYAAPRNANCSDLLADLAVVH